MCIQIRYLSLKVEEVSHSLHSSSFIITKCLSAFDFETTVCCCNGGQQATPAAAAAAATAMASRENFAEPFCVVCGATAIGAAAASTLLSTPKCSKLLILHRERQYFYFDGVLLLVAYFHLSIANESGLPLALLQTSSSEAGEAAARDARGPLGAAAASRKPEAI